MKYSKTALGLLNAQYRSVLRKCFLINMGLFALGAIAATPANAVNITADTNLNEQFPDGTLHEIINSISGYTGTLTTDNISIDPTSGSRGVQVWYDNSKVVLGADNTESVKVNSANDIAVIAGPKSSAEINGNTVELTGKTSALYASGNSHITVNAKDEMIATSDGNAISAWATGSYDENSGGKINISTGDLTVTSGGIGVGANYAKSQINIDATGDVNITATDRAIHAGNSTTEKNITKDDTSYVSIKAENITLTSDNLGVSAMSNGIVELDGNTKIVAKDAILARGLAKVEINKSGENTVQMDGNINFNYDKATSGSKVDAIVDVTLSGEDSYWKGNTTASYGSGEPPSGDYLKVSSSTLTLKDGATWTATKITDNAGDTEGQKYAALNNLTVDHANVVVKDETRGITVDNLVAKEATISEGVLNVAKTADLRDGVKNNYGTSIHVNDDASIYVDAAADGSLDEISGDKSKITLENVTLLSAMDGGENKIQTAGYKVSDNALSSLQAYYKSAAVNTATGNIDLGDKQSYTDLIGIEQNGNYIKAFDAADAENTSVSANLSALDNQVFENETNIAQNTADIATNADAIAQNAADIAGKQDTLTEAQLAAANSGITADKVNTYDGYATSKQDTLSTEQLAAANSGITADKVNTYDGYAAQINAKADAATTYTKDEVNTALNGKVDKVDGMGLSSNDYTTADKTKLAGIAEGAQVNVIEGVQVNGTDLTPDSDKKVNITVAEGTENGTIAVNGTDVAVKGLGSAAYTSADAYDVKGAAAAVQGNTAETVASVDTKVTNLTQSLKDYAANVETATGGTFADDGTWSHTIAAKDVNYTAGLTYSDIMSAVDQITSNVGTAIAGVNRDATLAAATTAGTKTVNANIDALDAAIGDLDYTGGTVSYELAKGSATDGIKTIVATIGEQADNTYGNLDAAGAEATINDNLDALDAAIGDRSNIASKNDAINQGTARNVAAGLKAAGDAIGDMNFGQSHYVSAQNDLSGAVRTLDSNLYRVETDLHDLKRDFNRGMASMAAMSALVPNPRAHGNTSLAIGTGAYSGHTAAAIGGFHYLTDNIMLNAGAAWGNSRDVSYRMGVTFSW